MHIPLLATSGLLRQVAVRVLPAATFILLLIWLMVGQVSELVFQDEINAKLKQQAENHAIFARTRLDNLVTTVRGIAGNDLIVNGLVDIDADANYLKPFLRSIAIEGFSNIPIVLTDYRGRPIAGRQLTAWHQPDLTQWNKQVSQEQPVLTLKDSGLVVGVPVYIGHLVEGMLVVRFLQQQLDQLLSPIGTNGRVELMSIDDETAAVGHARSSEGNDTYSRVELALPESSRLKLVGSVFKGYALILSSQSQGSIETSSR